MRNHCKCGKEIKGLGKRCASCANKERWKNSKFRKKMSKIMSIAMEGNKNALGLKWTEEGKENGSIAQNKRYEDLEEHKKCPWYIDGRSYKYDFPYLRPEHLEWSNKIRERDNFTCQLCGKEGFCAHHIDYNKDNFSLDNGICLCNKCHPKTNIKDRMIWTEFFKILIDILVKKDVISCLI